MSFWTKQLTNFFFVAKINSIKTSLSSSAKTNAFSVKVKTRLKKCNSISRFICFWEVEEGRVILIVRMTWLSVLPDFRFSGGLMTNDLDLLTRSERRLTSLMKAVALSGSRIIGRCFVGVTQYSWVVVNILLVFNMFKLDLFETRFF